VVGVCSIADGTEPVEGGVTLRRGEIAVARPADRSSLQLRQTELLSRGLGLREQGG
jgi:hypothetical protein